MKRLFAVILGIMLALFILEIGLRLSFNFAANDPVFARQQAVLRYTYNSISRLSLEANLQTNLTRSGYDVTYTINEHGYRGPSFSITKPEDTLRILTLGGSAAFDVVTNSAWPNALADHIQAATYDIEPINGGLPGNSTPNSLGRLAGEAWMFEPDYVLVYHCWNDLKWMNTVNGTQSLIDDQTYDMGRLVNTHLREHYLNNIDLLLSQSHLYLAVRPSLFPLRATLEGPPIDNRPDAAVTDQGVRQYHLNIHAIVDFAHQIGAQPVLIAQARLPTTESTPEARSLIRYDFVNMTHDDLVDGFAQCDAALRDVAESADVPLIDETLSLNGDERYFVDHVHLTPEGSARLADIVGTRLNDLIQVQHQP